MLLMLTLGFVFELGIHYVPFLWQNRRFLLAIPIASVGFWIGQSILLPKDILWVMLLAIMLFRLINLLKLSKNNVHQKYLQRVGSRTSIILGISSLALVWLYGLEASFSHEWLITLLAFTQLCVALLLLAVTSKNLQKTAHHPTKHHFTDKELPTVSVAIPARNETNDLASCLRTILANDYPKLEVIVYDDCSHDRTAEIIKDFAHDGVRFIAGEAPKDTWLAKNQAYQALAQNASGEIVLFCGVDVRFGPQAIRSLVSSMLSRKRDMMSVLPFRIGGGVDTSLVQPLRYWWELALPRRLFNRPPVLSTCWLISQKQLKKLGYFKGVAHNILPERFFARELVKTDKYAFIRADEQLDVRTVKPIEEQLKTAIRVKYPALRKKPEHTLLLVTLQFTLLLLPVWFAITVFWHGITITNTLAVISTAILVLTHYVITSASHPLHSTVAFFNYPFAIATDIVLNIVSLLQYEFGKVEWKGRNICLPAMHVTKRLPKID